MVAPCPELSIGSGILACFTLNRAKHTHPPSLMLRVGRQHHALASKETACSCDPYPLLLGSCGGSSPCLPRRTAAVYAFPFIHSFFTQERIRRFSLLPPRLLLLLLLLLCVHVGLHVNKTNAPSREGTRALWRASRERERQRAHFGGWAFRGGKGEQGFSNAHTMTDTKPAAAPAPAPAMRRDISMTDMSDLDTGDNLYHVRKSRLIRLINWWQVCERVLGGRQRRAVFGLSRDDEMGSQISVGEREREVHIQCPPIELHAPNLRVG